MPTVDGKQPEQQSPGYELDGKKYHVRISGDKSTGSIACSKHAHPASKGIENRAHPSFFLDVLIDPFSHTAPYSIFLIVLAVVVQRAANVIDGIRQDVPHEVVNRHQTLIGFHAREFHIESIRFVV